MFWDSPSVLPSQNVKNETLFTHKVCHGINQRFHTRAAALTRELTRPLTPKQEVLLSGCFLGNSKKRISAASRLMPLTTAVPAHTDISYVVPPTPVTFLTLPWRLGLRLAPWELGWQSICPLTFMASLCGKRTEKITQHEEIT